jgi:hypothetical protein
MGQGREAGDGDGANFGLSAAERSALRVIAKHGRVGATAKEIMPMDEASGLAIATELVRRKLAVATEGNHFVLAKYADEIRPMPFVADDDGRTLRFEHPYRAPLLRSTSRPAPVDITGMKITKLPPGEAIGARDLKRWRSSNLRQLSKSGVDQYAVEAKKKKRKRLRLKRRDQNCLVARSKNNG